MGAKSAMTEFYPPLFRNDLRQRYAQSLVLHIPKDSDLWRFIQEEHWEDTETTEETIIRLLTERLSLSCQGF